MLALSKQAYIQKLSFLFSTSMIVKFPTTPIVTDFYKQLETTVPVEDTSYRALVGGLIFIARSTHPDISFAVSLLTQAFSAPTSSQVQTACRCLAYLVGTSSRGPLSNDLVAFSESDWANCPST